MIGEVKEVTAGGKKYEIIKRGSSVAMSLQSIFTLLLTRARLELGADIPASKLMSLVSVGLTDDLIARIKEKVIQCTSAPAITEESFEELHFSIPSELFSEIYDFHCGEADKKKEKPEKS